MQFFFNNFNFSLMFNYLDHCLPGDALEEGSGDLQFPRPGAESSGVAMPKLGGLCGLAWHF